MPVIFLSKNISCDSSIINNCSETIQQKLETEYPELKEHENYHLSILHENGNHLIFFCIYEKDGQALCCHSHSELKQSGKNYMAEFHMLHKDTQQGEGVDCIKCITSIDNEEQDDPTAKKYTGKMPTLAEVENIL